MPPEVREFWQQTIAERTEQHRVWREGAESWRKANPDKAALLDAHVERVDRPTWSSRT